MPETLTVDPNPTETDPARLPAPEQIVEADVLARPTEPTPHNRDAIRPELDVLKTTVKVLGSVAVESAGKLRQAAKSAGSSITERSRESSRKTAEKLKKDNSFYKSLGEKALTDLSGKPVRKKGAEKRREAEIPTTRSQRRRATKVELKLKEHERQIKLDKWRQEFFKDTTHHSEIRKRATKQARKQAIRNHENAYINGTLTPKEYIKGLEKASTIVITRDDKMMRKSKDRIKESVDEIKAIADPLFRRKIRNARISFNEMLAGKPTAANRAESTISQTSEPVATQDPIPAIPEATPAPVVPETPKTDAELHLERLRKLRDEGLLPPPSVKAGEVTAEEPVVTPEAVKVQSGSEEVAELLSFVEAGVDDPELYKEIMSRKGNVKKDYYVSGGEPAYPGADHYVGTTRHEYYEYVYTDAEGKTHTERISDELAEKILNFEPPTSAEPEEPTPTKAPATKKAARKAKAPAKKRTDRTVSLEDLAKELGTEEDA